MNERLSPRETDALDAILSCEVVRFSQLAIDLETRIPAEELPAVLHSLRRRGLVEIEMNATNPTVFATAGARSRSHFNELEVCRVE